MLSQDLTGDLLVDFGVEISEVVLRSHVEDGAFREDRLDDFDLIPYELAKIQRIALGPSEGDFGVSEEDRLGYTNLKTLKKALYTEGSQPT